MKSNRETTKTPVSVGSPAPRSKRAMLLWSAAGAGLALGVGAGVLLLPRFSDSRLSAGPAAVSIVSAKFVLSSQAGMPVRSASTSVAAPMQREITPTTRALVQHLCDPGFGDRLTAEAASAWDEALSQLIAAGPAAVPAIREFLARNTEHVLGAGARRVLGYDSARSAMIDALVQIGGAEAEAALAITLAETLDPREIATLARNLERMAPGQYGQVAVDVAWQSLAAGSRGALQDRDVAPVFEVLNRYGNSANATDLEGVATRWTYYAALSLAQLPEGAGVSSLVRLAESSVSGPAADPAIQMLGSLASKNAEARAAFLDLVKNNRISTNTWTQIAPIFAGAQLQFAAGVLGSETPLDHGAGTQRVHLSHGNQNYWIGMPAVAIRAEESELRLAWLDQLSAVATQPAAQAAIQQAWKLILARQNPLAANVP